MSQRELKDLTEHSIEDWCKEFIEQGEFSPMSNKEAELFVLCKLQEQHIQNSKDFDEDISSFGLYQILKKRIEHIHTYTATKSVIMFVSSCCDSPAIVVMMANYLQYRAFKSGIKNINMDMLGIKIIPNGIPSKAQFKKAWENQKVVKYNAMSSDNMLDYSYTLKSIQFK